MALTIKEKEKLDQLDFATGGGFSDFLTSKKNWRLQEVKYCL